MDTKAKGDIAEQATLLEFLKRGYDALQPIGDRLPYDLVVTKNNTFVRIQVKSAWYDKSSMNYQIDVRRTKTNRRVMKQERYGDNDFDFASIYIPDYNRFYIMPIAFFNSYKSSIALIVDTDRQRKPRSYDYLEAWHLVDNFTQ